MYTIKLLFGDSQGGHLGFKGGQKPPLPPLNETLVVVVVLCVYVSLYVCLSVYHILGDIIHLCYNNDSDKLHVVCSRLLYVIFW